jgi:hypothetical protein
MRVLRKLNADWLRAVGPTMRVCPRPRSIIRPGPVYPSPSYSRDGNSRRRLRTYGPGICPRRCRRRGPVLMLRAPRLRTPIPPSQSHLGGYRLITSLRRTVDRLPPGDSRMKSDQGRHVFPKNLALAPVAANSTSGVFDGSFWSVVQSSRISMRIADKTSRLVRFAR